MTTIDVRLLGGPTRSLAVKTVSGEVVDIQKKSETNISSSGSGHINTTTGTIVMPRIKSSTTHIDTLFLKGTDGYETAVEIMNSDVPVRVGSKISVVYATDAHDAAGKRLLVGLVNNDTNSSARIGQARDVSQAFKISGKGANRLGFGGLAIGGVIGALLAQHWGGFIGGAFVGYMLGVPMAFPADIKAMMKMESELKDAVQAAVTA